MRNLIFAAVITADSDQVPLIRELKRSASTFIQIPVTPTTTKIPILSGAPIAARTCRTWSRVVSSEWRAWIGQARGGAVPQACVQPTAARHLT